jgi:hypothetical protein
MNGTGHHIIKETSDSLVQLLSNQFKESGYKRVHIIVAAPKPDAIEGKLPAVCLYLYQVALDEEGLETHVRHEIVEVPQPDGSVKEFMRRAPMWVRLDYLISTWAQTPEDEQLLLGLAIKGVLENPCLERERLKGDSFTDKFELPLTLSSRLDEGTLARFWGSLNQPVRPAIQAWTSVPIRADKLEAFTRTYQPPEIRYRDLNSRGGQEEKGPIHEVDMPPVSGMSPTGKRIMTQPKTTKPGR